MIAERSKEGIPWEPGFWKRLPWTVMAAILGFFISCGMMALVLALSNGKETAVWPTAEHPISVAVILSILVGVANTCLTAAVDGGYTVAWWLKALTGAKIKELQFDIQVRGNLLAVVQEWRLFDRFAAMAVIALAVSLLDGPIIQRASTSVGKTVGPQAVSLEVAMLSSPLPANFSSGYAGSGTATSLLSPGFRDVYKAYSNRSSIALPYTGCTNGVCQFSIPGPGFDIKCSDSTTPYNFTNLVAVGPLNATEITTLQINITFAPEQSVGTLQSMNLSVIYKPNSSCAGDLIEHQCVLQAATVSYPVTVSNGSAVLASWELSRNDTISITNFTSWMQLGSGTIGGGGFNTMFGGIAQVLQALFQSSTTLRLADMTSVPFLITSTGQGASTYLTSDSSSYGDCTMTWSDPRTDIVNILRELMFRSAIAVLSGKSQAVQAQETRFAVVYESRFEYFSIAIACMLVQVLAIVFLLWGFGKLGRDVSLDPFEIGKALDAPLLRAGSSNSSVDQLLEIFGEKQVRYGEVLGLGDSFGSGKSESVEEAGGNQQNSGSGHTDGEHTVESHEQDSMLGNAAVLNHDEGGEFVTRRPRLGLQEVGEVQEVRAGFRY